MQNRFLSYLHCPYFLVIGLFLILTSNTYGFNDKSQKHEIDSLKTLVQNCTTDTAKFKILYGFFWNNYYSDYNKAKPIGLWAYNEIKNSNNLKALTDGLDLMGCIYEKENKYDSAYPLYQKALRISKTIGYTKRTGWSYFHLGLIKKNKGDVDSAAYFYKKAIDFNKSDGFDESVFDMLTETAYLYESNECQDSALLYYKNAITYARKIKNVSKEINAYFNIAWLYGKQNNTKTRVENLNKAMLLAEKSSNSEAILKVYYTIGNLFFTEKHNYDLALQYYLKALEKCPLKYKYNISSLNNEIANVLIAKGEDSAALRFTLISLSIARSINHKHQISEAFKNLGKIYAHQGALNRAITSYSYCYNLGCDECPKIKFHDALLDIANSYLKLKNSAKALDYYNKSLKLADDFHSPTEQAISKLKLGNFYRNSNLSLSLKMYKEAFNLANQTKEIKLKKDISDTLTTVCRNMRDFKAASNYQLLARLMNDSLNTIQRQESMANWETRFEFEKLNNESQSRQLEIKKQKLLRNSALLGASLLLILGIVVFQSYRRKKKDNKILVEQKGLIEEKNQEILAQVEEITSQKDEIERISDELHEADEQKLRFFANVSHELRTPLTLILNPAKNLLETSPYNGEYKKQLEYIYNNALKLQDLTNQIMDLQKLDTGKLQLNLEKGDIVGYCLGVASSFESMCAKKENIIRFYANCNSAITLFDKDKIGKILGNLLSNALKFCFSKTIIDLHLDISIESISLSVLDKGIGIPSDQTGDVFNRYYQASTNSKAEGTGIGLAYVKELVVLMGGNVSIQSILNEYTDVKVAIPVKEIEIENESAYVVEIPSIKIVNNTEALDWNETNEDESKKTILIVEDNDDLRAFISDLLKNEFNIQLAKDGKEGMQAAFQALPDIIISDVMMPQINGFEMCTILKKDERTSHIPIILLTAKDSSQSYREGYETGADDYILKPFDNELLKLKVRNVIATHDAARRQFDFQSILTVENLKLGNTDKEFMKKCLAEVEKNIDNSTFGVDQLAEALAFSSRNFYRKIKSLTNQTPAELIRIYRLHYAKQLLQKTHMRVSEIAGAVGYDDVKRFSQAFKKQFEVLPSELHDYSAS
jgi:signal transduction histidine kinase/DNA-binding response OmpR family regulator